MSIKLKVTRRRGNKLSPRRFVYYRSVLRKEVTAIGVVRQVSEASNIPQATIRKVLDALSDYMQIRLAKGDKICVRGIGSFAGSVTSDAITSEEELPLKLKSTSLKYNVRYIPENDILNAVRNANKEIDDE